MDSHLVDRVVVIDISSQREGEVFLENAPNYFIASKVFNIEGSSVMSEVAIEQSIGNANLGIAPRVYCPSVVPIALREY